MTHRNYGIMSTGQIYGGASDLARPINAQEGAVPAQSLNSSVERDLHGFRIANAALDYLTVFAVVGGMVASLLGAGGAVLYFLFF